MPVLLLELLLLFDLRFHEAATGLHDESHLGGDAEIADNKQLKLFQEGFAGKLVLVTVRLHEVLHSNWLDLHDVTDIQIQDPFILV